MSQKTKVNSTPVFIEAELPNVELAKDKDCEKCNARFRCWTNRGTALKVESFTLSNDGMSGDRLKFVVIVPQCFRCSNLVGSYAIVHVKIAEQEQHIRSLIMNQVIRAEGTSPMTLEIESVSRFDI